MFADGWVGSYRISAQVAGVVMGSVVSGGGLTTVYRGPGVLSCQAEESAKKL